MPTCVLSPTVEGREDLEFRALVHAAGAGLAGGRTPAFTKPSAPQPTGHLRVLIALLLIATIPLIALPVRMALAARRPVERSRLWDAAGFVESDAPRSAGRFLVATVRRKKPAKRNSAAAMLKSQRDALAAALACAPERRTVNIRWRSKGVVGPSAGLIFGLAVVDHLVAADVTAGRRIAGTGTLSATGRVGPVGDVAEKAAAAQRARADVFFVPIGQRAEAQRKATELKVVGVRDLADAVRTLVGSGCR